MKMNSIRGKGSAPYNKEHALSKSYRKFFSRKKESLSTVDLDCMVICAAGAFAVMATRLCNWAWRVRAEKRRAKADEDIKSFFSTPASGGSPSGERRVIHWQGEDGQAACLQKILDTPKPRHRDCQPLLSESKEDAMKERPLRERCQWVLEHDKSFFEAANNPFLEVWSKDLVKYYAEFKADKTRKSPNALLMKGKPGTGKTHFMYKLSSLGFPPIFVDSTAIASKYHGGGEEKLQDILRQVQTCLKDGFLPLIFMDEVDALIPKRTDEIGAHTDNRITPAVLKFMEELHDLGVPVVGATNCIDNVDPAALRPGRFSFTHDMQPIKSAEEVKKQLRKILDYNGYNLPDKMVAPLMKMMKKHKQDIGNYSNISGLAGILDRVTGAHAADTKIQITDDILKKAETYISGMSLGVQKTNESSWGAWGNWLSKKAPLLCMAGLVSSPVVQALSALQGAATKAVPSIVSYLYKG